MNIYKLLLTFFIIIIFISIPVNAGVFSIWDSNNADLKNSGLLNVESKTNGSILWYNTTGSLSSSWVAEIQPLIDNNGNVYYHDGDDKVFAFSGDGTPKWAVTLPDVDLYTYRTNYALDANYLYLCSEWNGVDETLIAIYLNNGSIAWRSDVNGNGYQTSEIVVYDEYLYTVDTDGKLTKAYKNNGSVIWTYPVGDYAYGLVVDTNGVIYTTKTTATRYLKAIYPNGTLKWETVLPSYYSKGIALNSNNDVYLITAYDTIRSFYNSNGTAKNSVSIGTYLSEISIDDNDNIYVGYGGNVRSYYPNLSLRFNYAVNNASSIYHNIILDSNENMYFGGQNSSGDGFYWGMYPNGTIIYQFIGSDYLGSYVPWFMGSAMDNDGKIFAITQNSMIFVLNSETIIPTTFNFNGNVKLLDIDNSSFNLENAYIRINDTLNTYTDSNGNYAIELPYGTYSYTINYSLGTEILSDSVTSLDADVTNNYYIEFSRPFLSNPEISGNYFLTSYTHNYKTMNLWENPNYVWGNYTYDGNSYIQNCEYVSGTIFKCPNIDDKTYTFKFVYSDYYNHRLSDYHPNLTGSRQLSTDYLYFTNGVIVNNETGEAGASPTPIKISDSNQEDREKRTYNTFMDAVFFMVLVVFVILIISFGDKRR